MSVQCLNGDHTATDRPTFESTEELTRHIIAVHVRPVPLRNHIRWTLIELRELRVPLYAAVLAVVGVAAGTWGIMH